jgi:hypothetical protein
MFQLIFKKTNYSICPKKFKSPQEKRLAAEAEKEKQLQAMRDRHAAAAQKDAGGSVGKKDEKKEDKKGPGSKQV